MIDQITFLTNALITIPSVKEDISSLNLVLELAQQELTGYTYKRFESNNIPSLLFYNTPTPPEKFKVILNAHLDVVPGTTDQFHPFEKQGRIYGRGAYDMKAGAAISILLFKNLAKKIAFPLGLQLVTDEENGGYDGTAYQLKQGVKTEFVIAGDSSNFSLVHEAKTLFWIKVNASGKTEHAGYPWLGENAIAKMTKFIQSVEQYFPKVTNDNWTNTVTVSRIDTSNVATNKIPWDCHAIFDIRCIPQDREKVFTAFIHLIPEDFSYEVLLDEPAEFTPKDSPFLQKLLTITKEVTGKTPDMITKHGLSDVRFFMEQGAHGTQFGPKGAGHHSDNEWVDIKNLQEYYHILEKFLLSF